VALRALSTPTIDNRWIGSLACAMKHLLLALLFLPSLALAEYLEIRKVVPTAPGAKTIKVPKSGEEIALSPELLVSEKHVASAYFTPGVSNHQPDYHAVALTLTEEGGKRMAEATKDALANHLRLAILVDGKVVAAPVVRSAPLGKQIEIALSSAEEAEAVAKALQPKK
jgi:preprotein translocase subunit SecD